MTVPTLKLNNDINIPQLGLGLYKAHEGEQAQRTVRTALDAGYRSFDTAALYGNEHAVGLALAESDVPREELFVTTKVWNADQGYDSTLRAFEMSMHRLGLEYIDLYLIHWPVARKYKQTWKALEHLYDQKVVRAIGVSNFQTHHLDDLLADANVVPAVNQVELHPRLTQTELRGYCDGKGIVVESWSPLMAGGEILQNMAIARIAAAHGKTPAQVVLRWHIQSGLVVIPKSVTPERISENIEIFDFELTAEDIKAIDDLDEGRRVGPDPDNFDF
jgi:diketogulonate reductase-like aldo/keto reductase